VTVLNRTATIALDSLTSGLSAVEDLAGAEAVLVTNISTRLDQLNVTALQSRLAQASAQADTLAAALANLTVRAADCECVGVFGGDQRVDMGLAPALV
jgi:hypothetical protein